MHYHLDIIESPSLNFYEKSFPHSFLHGTEYGFFNFEKLYGVWQEVEKFSQATCFDLSLIDKIL